MKVVDMTATIAPKSDQINADTLMGGPLTVTITRVTGNEGNAEQPVNVFFAGEEMPFRPCKSMRRVMVSVWGSDASQYVGKSMTLFRDPKVKWGGMEVGGIRISHMSGLTAPKQLALTETRAKRTPYTVQPLKDAPAPAAKADGDPAKEWADKFVANVARAPDLAKLETYIGNSKSKLVDLEAQDAAAFALCDQAITNARGKFTAEEADPFQEAAE